MECGGTRDEADMTMHESTPATATTTQGRRPALHDVTRLTPVNDPAHGAAADTTDVTNGTDGGGQDPASAIQAQVQQVEALLAAVRETVGSLAQASLRLEREVEHALETVPGRAPAPSRPQRPSAAHPAQAAVERAALLEAVENRAVIEQAKGMLMLKHRCDADSAFGLLVEVSRRERRKVREIAGDIVRSGTRPRRVVDVTDAAVTSGRVADQARAR
jgi:hypothetical protein